MENFTTTMTIDQPPAKVFAAINDVRAWWTQDIDGRTDALGAEFTYRFNKDNFTKQRITELVANEKVVWHVTDSHINFEGSEEEWTGTDVVFELRKAGAGTELRFTHVGLHPECGCYDACKKGWSFYVHQSLRNLITTGQGEPQRLSAA